MDIYIKILDFNQYQIVVMRVLYLHAKEFMYKPSKVVKGVPKDSTSTEERYFRDVLVLLVTIEEGDWKNRDNISNMLIEDLKIHINRISVKNVIIYPYAHLSDNLEEPNKAYRLLRYLENKMKDIGLQVHRAPFGWYKEFSIHIYGHPLAELSRRF